MNRKHGLLAALASASAMVGTGVLGAAPSSAAPRLFVTAGPAATPAGATRSFSAGPAVQSSTAGYFVTYSGLSSVSMSGETVVPQLPSGANGTATGGVMDQTMQFDSPVGSGVSAVCMFLVDIGGSQPGTGSYELMTSIVGNGTSKSKTGPAVAPGDVIAVRMSAASGQQSITVTDKTRALSFTQRGAVGWGTSGNALTGIVSAFTSIPTFEKGTTGPGSGPIQWYQQKVNGSDLGLDNPGLPANMVDSSGHVMIKTGAISSNTHFASTFVANS